MNTLVDFFILAGISQGAFMGAALIFSRHFKSKSNKYLGLAILTMTQITFLGWLDSEQWVMEWWTEIMWEFLFPVFLFLYFIQSLNHSFQNQKWTRWLFLPFVLSVLVKCMVDLLKNQEMITISLEQRLELYDHIEYNLSFFYGLFLVTWGGVMVWKARTEIGAKRKWLKHICLGVVSLYAVWLFADISESSLDMDLWNVLWSGLSILFLGLVYFGVFHLRLWEQRDEIEALWKEKKAIVSTIPKKGSATGAKHLQRLKQLMEEEELYKDPQLSRDQVAEKMEMSGSYLSSIVKELHEKSFVEYVNTFRIEAAKHMLRDPTFNKYSIQAIGLEAGFQSRSAFYDAFQKGTGKSPGAFKKSPKLS